MGEVGMGWARFGKCGWRREEDGWGRRGGSGSGWSCLERGRGRKGWIGLGEGPASLIVLAAKGLHKTCETGPM